MAILAIIAMVGFVGVLIMHVSAAANLALVDGQGEIFLAILACPGIILTLIMVISAWEWSWGDFLANITDDMPNWAKWLAFMMVAYPLIVIFSGGKGAAVYRTMHPESISNLRTMWEVTGALLPLYLIPALYFWKERPR